MRGEFILDIDSFLRACQNSIVGEECSIEKDSQGYKISNSIEETIGYIKAKDNNRFERCSEKNLREAKVEISFLEMSKETHIVKVHIEANQDLPKPEPMKVEFEEPINDLTFQQETISSIPIEKPIKQQNVNSNFSIAKAIKIVGWIFLGFFTLLLMAAINPLCIVPMGLSIYVGKFIKIKGLKRFLLKPFIIMFIWIIGVMVIPFDSTTTEMNNTSNIEIEATIEE